jgi:hypothetical protein
MQQHLALLVLTAETELDNGMISVDGAVCSWPIKDETLYYVLYYSSVKTVCPLK